MQKCYTCQNYAGGCSWTEIDPETDKVRFKPIPGWDATPTSRSVNGERIMESYDIRDCPQYVPDGLSRLSLEDQVLLLHGRGVSLRQIAIHTGILSENRLRKIIQEAEK